MNSINDIQKANYTNLLNLLNFEFLRPFSKCQWFQHVTRTYGWWDIDKNHKDITSPFKL